MLRTEYFGDRAGCEVNKMINNEINAIKDSNCMTIMPKRIYLFGSSAKDTYNEDSDYDFYVVVPDEYH